MERTIMVEKRYTFGMIVPGKKRITKLHLTWAAVEEIHNVLRAISPHPDEPQRTAAPAFPE